MEVPEKARRLLEDRHLCDHCLGRQFAKLVTGTTNDERGRALKTVLGMQGHAEMEGSGDAGLLRRVAESGHDLSEATLEREGETVREEVCGVCGGLFEHLDGWADLAEAELEGYEFDTFLVGNRTPGDLVAKEEELWAEHGADHAEPLKTELNREVGRRLEERLDAVADLKRPEISILLKPESQEVEVEANPLYLYGRYRKLERGIPQTRWPCHVCEGEGCTRCDGTGMLYDDSVEGYVYPPVLEAAEGSEAVFHGCGREDVDARMLGEGRPFVLEIKNPKNRDLDPGKLQEEINEWAEGSVEVRGLRETSPDSVEDVKTSRPEKVYRAEVEGRVEEENLKEALRLLKGKTVVQETPTRVSHRRAEKSRERVVEDARLVESRSDGAVLEIEGEAGLYIKELVSGDRGRTTPSISGLTDTEISCERLDVLEVKYQRD